MEPQPDCLQSLDSDQPVADIAGSLHGNGAPVGPSRPTSVLGDDSAEEPLFGYGGRIIANPSQRRTDIGEIGILCANFGLERSGKVKRDYTRSNLKKSPATILGLQEAEEGVAQILEATAFSDPTPIIAERAEASAVAGQAEDLTTVEAHAVAGQAQGCTHISQRPEARFMVIMGNEHGATCLTAVRASLASEIKLLEWWWHLDGTWSDRGARKVARSRVLISEIRWRRPLANMNKLVHANIHMHHKTAKKHQGFADAHQLFFRELYLMLVRWRVRILSGDWNMSVFQVISILRQMGLIIDLGAIYPWKEVGNPATFSDSSAIFLIGGCQQIRLPFSLASFGCRGSCSGGSSVAPADGEQDRSQGSGSIRELDVFEKGQGYDLTSYLPKDRRQFENALQAMFIVSTDIDPQLNESQTLLPKWKQKLVRTTMFDPNDEFFRAGAHMPLLGFLGNAASVRSNAKLLERETKRREKKGMKHAGRYMETKEPREGKATSSSSYSTWWYK